MPKKSKRFDPEWIESLKLKESGEAESIVEHTVKKMSGEFPKASDILKAIGKNEEALEEKLEMLVESGKVIKLQGMDKPVYLHVDYVNKKLETMLDILQKYHDENPLRMGISKEEIKARVFGKNVKQKFYDELLQYLENRHKIKIRGNFISEYNFEVVYTGEQEKIRERILKEFLTNEFSPPKYSDLEAKEKDRKSFKMVFDSLIDSGLIIKVAEDCFFAKSSYEKCKKLTADFIAENGSITVAQLRDILETSRKYALTLMEHFDNIKYTKRIDDKRILF